MIDLISVRRCLQLVEAAKTYNFVLAIPGGSPVTLPCRYFVVDWLDTEIEDYFLADPSTLSGKYSAEIKLRLFNEILLGVEALHGRDVFHRDLKADNLRAHELEAGKRLVIAIDLGTAAKVDSGCISPGYGNPAGAPGYSSPEAIAGLTGNRLLGRANDKYALGCLLFEMFNRQYCYFAMRAANPNLDYILYAMGMSIPPGLSPTRQLEEWEAQLSTYSTGITPVDVGISGSLVPPGVLSSIDGLVRSLTHIDYRQRMSLEEARRVIWSTIRVLMNERLYQKRLREQRERRQRRLQRIQDLDARHRGKAISAQRSSC